MKRQWYGRDTQLTVRMFIVMFLLAAVYLGFITFLWEAGVDFFTLLIFAGVLLAVQYFLSDKIALWSVGAKEVTPEQAPELHAMVERLAQTVDLPKPKVAMVESDVPNAFATGRSPKNSVIAVTSSLMQRLQPQEVEAVLAHEMTHIRNRDVMVITLATFFATVANFLMRMLMFQGMYGGYGRRRDRDGGGSAIILVWVVSLVVWIISFVLIRALSRYREYAADRGSAIITGAPSLLASALMKISGAMSRIPQQDLRQVEGMNAFFIVPAINGASLSTLFSTHPPIEKRIERLEKMQQEMESFR